MKICSSLLFLHAVFGAKVFLGDFDNDISIWSISCVGSLSYLSKTTSNIRNPSWLTSIVDENNPNITYLYSVNQITDYDDNENGAISAFKGSIAGDNTTFIYQNTISSGGGSPNYVSVKRFPTTNSTFLYVSNAKHVVTVLSIERDGANKGNVKEVIQKETYNSTSYIHQVMIDGSNVFVVDRDNACIYQYSVDESTGLLIPPPGLQNQRSLPLPLGSGPRHLTPHPFSPYVFLVSETSCTLSILSYARESNGYLNYMSNVSLLDDSLLTSDMTGAEVQVHPNGLFVYASIRDVASPSQQRSSIVVYSFDIATGVVHFIQRIFTQGEHPRFFDIFQLDTGHLSLLVANKDSNNVATFSVSPDSGLLVYSGDVVSTLPYHDEPTHVLLVR